MNVGLNILFLIDYQFITPISVLKWVNNKIENSKYPLSILGVLTHFLFDNVFLHALKINLKYFFCWEINFPTI